jgi:hypothetical protein
LEIDAADSKLGEVVGDVVLEVVPMVAGTCFWLTTSSMFERDVFG